MCAADRGAFYRFGQRPGRIWSIILSWAVVRVRCVAVQGVNRAGVPFVLALALPMTMTMTISMRRFQAP